MHAQFERSLSGSMLGFFYLFFLGGGGLLWRLNVYERLFSVKEKRKLEKNYGKHVFWALIK